MAIPRFHANKNGDNQTGVASATWTTVTFSTADFNDGNYFSTSTSLWTPPAGMIVVGGCAYGSGTITSGKLFAVGIRKNAGTPGGGMIFGYTITNSFGPFNVTFADQANGTDTYGLGIYVTLASGTATIDGTSYFTNFWGYCVS